MQISVACPGELGPGEITAWHSMQRLTTSLASPFLSPEFAIAVGHFRPEARVAVLADGPEIVGFFPFERRRLGVGVPIGAGLNDCQGLIHAPGVEWDPQELLRACQVPVWQFDHLIADQRPFERYAVAVAPSPVIDLSDGFGTYQEKLRASSPKFCKNMGWKRRKLERDVGKLRFAMGSCDIPGLRTLMGWKSEQCRRNGWIDVFGRPWIVDFVDHLLAISNDRFGGLISLLCAGETPVAGQFVLRSGNHIAGLFTAYDPGFARYSPGIIQVLQLIAELAATGVNTIHMGPAADWKETLKTHDIRMAQGMVANGLLTATAHRVRRAFVSWTGRQLSQHPPLFRAADQLLQHYGRNI
jgi:CelD/BcsL family acetyltransferase involved in cellulose biosynthesis